MPFTKQMYEERDRNMMDNRSHSGCSFPRVLPPVLILARRPRAILEPEREIGIHALVFSF